MESLLEFGKKPVPADIFYNGKLEGSANKFIAERRAYAKFSFTGKNVGNCRIEPVTIESAGVSNSPYTNILSGPRLVPPPSLTSVDWSNDSANDIIDAYLWKATVNFVCYSPEQFESFDEAFFRHFNEVKLTLGWINGAGSTTITGNIIDYQFTINEKLQYDCSVTFAGKHTTSAAGLTLDKPFNSGVQETDLGMDANGFAKTFEAQAKKQNTGDPDEVGSSITNGDFIKLKIQNNTGIQAYIPDFIYTDTDIITYVSLNKIIEYINIIYISKENNFGGFNYYMPEDAIKKLNKIEAQSANPYVVINNYSPSDYEKLVLKSKSSPNRFYIATSKIAEFEGEMRLDKQDNPHHTKSTILQLLKKICGLINESVGFCVDLQVIPYGAGGNTDKYGYEITDRKTVIQKKITPTLLNILDKKCIVRSINVQSTTDSEMAAIAQAGAQGDGGKIGIMRKKLFECSNTTKETNNQSLSQIQLRTSTIAGNNDTPPYLQSGQIDLQNNLKAVTTAIANAPGGFIGAKMRGFKAEPYKDADLIEILMTDVKNHWANNPGKVSGYSYGVTCTVTVDGNPKFLFGNIFTVSGLPSMLRKNNVYFVVLKQGHKFDNGDWTMDIEGQMMFD